MSRLPGQFHGTIFMEALATAVSRGTTDTHAVVDALDLDGPNRHDRALYILTKLKTNGLLTHTRYGHWDITEKGCIACAIIAYQEQVARRRAAHNPKESRLW